MLIQFLKIFWHMLLCPNMFSVSEKFPTVFRPLYSLFCMIYFYTDFSLRVILDLLDLIIQYHLSLAFSQYFCLFHITLFISCIDFLISFNYLTLFPWTIFWVVWALLQLFYQFSIFCIFFRLLLLGFIIIGRQDELFLEETCYPGFHVVLFSLQWLI